MLKLKKVTKSSVELVEALCLSMNSFNNTPKQKLKKSKEETFLNDSKTKWQFKTSLQSKQRMPEKRVQSEVHRELTLPPLQELQVAELADLALNGPLGITVLLETLKTQRDRQVQESQDKRQSRVFILEIRYFYFKIKIK